MISRIGQSPTLAIISIPTATSNGLSEYADGPSSA
jgi:hypothetical protein